LTECVHHNRSVRKNFVEGILKGSTILVHQANKRKPVARKTTKNWENEIKP
jgi:hypothetical protein